MGTLPVVAEPFPEQNKSRTAGAFVEALSAWEVPQRVFKQRIDRR